MLNNVLMGVQLVLAALLILAIMPQESKDNFKSDFGGDGASTQAYFKPKGKQAFLLKTTKIVSVLFFIMLSSFCLLKLACEPYFNY